MEGDKDGTSDVEDVGEFVEASDGPLDGAVVGETVGCNDIDGAMVENVEGIAVGSGDGFTVGAVVGTGDGLFDGLTIIDGIFDDVSVGESVDMIAKIQKTSQK